MYAVSFLRFFRSMALLFFRLGECSRATSHSLSLLSIPISQNFLSRLLNKTRDPILKLRQKCLGVSKV